MIANQATGNVKRYQAICGSIQLLILPISYIYLSLGFPAYTVFVVHFTIECVTQIVRMIMLRSMIKIRIIDYIFYIYRPVLFVVIGSLSLPYLLSLYIDGDGVFKFLMVGLCCLISVSSFSYVLGLTANEREFVCTKVKKIICKIK